MKKKKENEKKGKEKKKKGKEKKKNKITFKSSLTVPKQKSSKPLEDK